MEKRTEKETLTERHRDRERGEGKREPYTVKETAQMGLEMEHILSHNWLCMANGTGTEREKERQRERERQRQRKRDCFVFVNR